MEISNGGWIKTFTLENSFSGLGPDHIRKMFIKKRPKYDREIIEKQKSEKYESENAHKKWLMSSYNKYHIVCISGINTINIVELGRRGQVTIKKCAETAPGRILNFTDDFSYNMGIIMLLDQSEDQESSK